jgi:OmpA-OmpF porin, OOP family
MGMSRRAAPLALLSAALLLGCANGRHGAIDASRYQPMSDQQIFLELGSFPSPGPNPSKDIHDTSGNVVERPSEGLSFADQVVGYEPGIPAPILEGLDPSTALGAPDYQPDSWKLPRAVSLGNGGSITLGFPSPLIDTDGPDLFIFEIGPGVEAMTVEVSADGKAWKPVGEAPGGSCAIDIAPFVEPGEAFRMVRIHDVADQGAESDFWPGADIDAVGVLTGAQRVALPSEVLFDFDSDVLAAGAPSALDSVVDAIKRRPGARVSVDGHTDDSGSAQYNLGLSERRAEAVASYLAQKGVPRERITARGYGEERPVAPNEDDASRRKNRRVEIVIRGR